MANPPRKRPTPPRNIAVTPRRTTSSQQVVDGLVAEFEVLRAEDERNAPKPLPPASRNLAKLAIAAVLVVLCAVTWVIAWDRLQPPIVDPLRCREQRLAELRLRLAAQARLVDKFARTHGDLPATLAVAGDPLLGIGYVKRPDDEYELVARDGSTILTYRSSERIEEFVGDAVSVVSQPCR